MSANHLENAPSRRLAVITGATGTIGRAVANELAARGWQLALIARSPARLAAVGEQLAGSAPGHPPVTTHPCDITSWESIVEVMRVIEQTHGTGVGVLVNAAGSIGPLDPFTTVDPAEWSQTIDVNLIGPMFTCRAVIPSMIERGWGRIVNISSASSLVAPHAGNGAYETGKAALNLATRYLAASLEGTGVTANLLHPGEVQSDMAVEIAQLANAGGGTAVDAYQRWISWLDRTGGDPPSLAADRVCEIIDDPDEPNGQFLWIRGGAREPFPAWLEGVETAPPWAAEET